jgi:glycosyltransferase 2 family protein
VNKLWLRLFQIVLLGLVAWFVYRSFAPKLAELDRASLSQYRPRLLPLILSTLILTGVNIVHALIWRAIAYSLSGKTLSIRATMKVFFVSSLGRYVPGKVWQLAGTAVMAQREGFPATAATAALLVKDLAVLTGGMVLLSVLLPGRLDGELSRERVILAVALLGVAIALFIFTLTNAGRAIRHRLLSKLGPRIAEAGAMLDRLTLKHAVEAFLMCLASWIFVAFAFDLFVGAFVPGELPALSLAGVVIASYIGGYIALMPAGAGAREGLMLLLLTPIITAPAALIVSILSRLWFTAGEMLPLLVIPVLPNRSREPV